MNSITPLLNAIYSTFTSTPALVSAFPGGLHREVAAPGTAMPFAVTTLVSGPITDTYSLDSADVRIQFSVYGVGHDATAAKLKTLLDAYNDVLLTITGGTQFSIAQPETPRCMRMPDDGSGNDVWHWWGDLIFSIQ